METDQLRVTRQISQLQVRSAQESNNLEFSHTIILVGERIENLSLNNMGGNRGHFARGFYLLLKVVTWSRNFQLRTSSFKKQGNL